MQGEHRIMIAKFRHEMYFADTPGRSNVPFSQTAIQADDASIITVPPQCLRFPRNLGSFSSLQVLSGRNYRSSRF